MKRKIFVFATIIIASAGVGFAADASALWGQHCAACHGKDGSGSTMMGKKLGLKIIGTRKSRQHSVMPKRNEQSKKA